MISNTAADAHHEQQASKAANGEPPSPSPTEPNKTSWVQHQAIPKDIFQKQDIKPTPNQETPISAVGALEKRLATMGISDITPTGGAEQRTERDDSIEIVTSSRDKRLDKEPPPTLVMPTEAGANSLAPDAGDYMKVISYLSAQVRLLP